MTDLRAVFDALDVHKRGYITVEEFEQSFQNFEGSIGTASDKEKKLKTILHEISPNGDGRVSFDSFSYGIQHVMKLSQNGKPNAFSNVIPDLIPSQPLNNKESLLSLPSVSQSELMGSSIGELDITLGAEHNDNNGSSQPDSARSAAKRLLKKNGIHTEPPSSARPPSYPSVKGVKCNSVCSIPSGSASINREGIRSTWPKRRQRILEGYGNVDPFQELVGDRGGQPQRRHRRNDSASSFASSLAGSRSDLFQCDTESNSGRIQDQLNRLTQKLESLTSDHNIHDQRNSQLREDNRLLRERIHQLEELVRDAEAKASQMVQMEKENFQRKLSSVDREHHNELERMRSKLYTLENELSELRVESAAYRGESEKYKWSRDLLQEKLNDADRRTSELQSTFDNCREQSKSEIERLRGEREKCEQKLEKANQELTFLRERMNQNSLSPMGFGGMHIGVSDLHQRYREMQELVHSLTVENKSLREQLSEAQEELMCNTLREGKNLLKGHEVSLAAELDTYSKDELMDLLMKEKDANYKLRDYIDKLISRIIEREPSLLEIEN